jgi:Phage integrase family
VGQLHRPRQDVCHPSSRRTPAAGVARRQRCPAPIRPAAAEQRAAIPGDHADAIRLRGLIVVLWRAGVRISEALALNESDLDRSRGAILVRRGKGGKRREVGMDRSAWEQLNPWLQLRSTLPVGALFCVLRGATRGRPWAPAGVRSQQPRPERVCGAASHHTSFGTLMPSRRPERNPELPGGSRAGSDCAGCAVVRSNEAAAAFWAGRRLMTGRTMVSSEDRRCVERFWAAESSVRCRS